MRQPLQYIYVGHYLGSPGLSLAQFRGTFLYTCSQCVFILGRDRGWGGGAGIVPMKEMVRIKWLPLASNITLNVVGLIIENRS